MKLARELGGLEYSGIVNELSRSDRSKLRKSFPIAFSGYNQASWDDDNEQEKMMLYLDGVVDNEPLDQIEGRLGDPGSHWVGGTEFFPEWHNYSGDFYGRGAAPAAR